MKTIFFRVFLYCFIIYYLLVHIKSFAAVFCRGLKGWNFSLRDDFRLLVSFLNAYGDINYFHAEGKRKNNGFSKLETDFLLCECKKLLQLTVLGRAIRSIIVYFGNWSFFSRFKGKLEMNIFMLVSSCVIITGCKKVRLGLTL